LGPKKPAWDILGAVTRALAAAAAFTLGLGVAWIARADTPAQDLRAASSTTTNSSKWAGSSVEGSTYIGTGSFYASGYRDPYTSIALFVRPTYDLGTKYKLALRARLYVEEELTLPDNTAGRRFYPYDPWVWLAADNLHTFERSKIRIGGLARLVLPLSYESRYQHLLFGVGFGPNVNRIFELGQPGADDAHKWTLGLTYGFIFYKYVQSSDFRGSGPGDTTGCLAPPSPGAPGVGGEGGPTGSAADRCGGPANTNFAFANVVIATLAHGKWSALATLLLSNQFNYSIPADALTSTNAVATGRTDTTWGIVALSYQLRPRLGLSAGVSSQQPALDARYRYPRFPFFDFTNGANANNFTQFFLSVNGTL
jgi:hypothetical protein